MNESKDPNKISDPRELNKMLGYRLWPSQEPEAMGKLKSMLDRVGIKYTQKKSPGTNFYEKEPWYGQLPFTGLNIDAKDGFVSIVTHGPVFEEGAMCEIYVSKLKRCNQCDNIQQAENFLKCVLGIPVEGPAEIQYKEWLHMYDSKKTRINRKKKARKKLKGKGGVEGGV